MKAMMTECPDELEFFNKFVDKELTTRLQQTLDKPFERISYTVMPAGHASAAKVPL